MPLRFVPVHGSLALQQLLYYNILFSLLFFAFELGLVVHKIMVVKVDDIAFYSLPPVFGVWAIVELGRLRLGYFGNLKERVPELAAFLIVSVFPQLPLVAFMCFVETDRLPMDSVLGVVQSIFLLLELWFALLAVRHFMAEQTALFFRACQQADEDEDQSAEAVGEAPDDRHSRSASPRWSSRRSSPLAGRSPPFGSAQPGLGTVLQQGVRGLRGAMTLGGADGARREPASDTGRARVVRQGEREGLLGDDRKRR